MMAALLRSTTTLLAAFAGLAAMGCAAGTMGDAPDFGDFSEPPPPGPQLAAGLQITAVTMSQGVSIDLFRAGAPADERAAPLLTGRGGIVRVFVDVEAGWQPRPIRGELWLRSGDDELVYEDEEEPEGASQAESQETTFDFEFPAEALQADTTISVRLWEVEVEAEGAAQEGGTDRSAWPAVGSEPLRATEAGGILRVMLLPIRYDADGSGRLPDTGAEVLGAIEDKLRQLFPVREVELTLAEPHPSEIEILGDGTGFGDQLSALRDVRQERGVPFETYVHALVVPAATMSSFCAAGCTTGLAYRVASPFAADSKVSLGLGYSAGAAARIIVHEVGHQHDRGHAPCGNVGNPDPEFPYEGGRIGVEGWDVLSGDRMDPEMYADFMSYCPDRWVSDYTWAALHQRILGVEGLRSSRERPQLRPYLSFAVDAEGGLRFERRHELRFTPSGPQWTVQLLDSRGFSLGEAAASFLPFSDLPGGTLVLPAPGKGVAAVRAGAGAAAWGLRSATAFR